MHCAVCHISFPVKPIHSSYTAVPVLSFRGWSSTYNPSFQEQALSIAEIIQRCSKHCSCPEEAALRHLFCKPFGQTMTSCPSTQRLRILSLFTRSPKLLLSPLLLSVCPLEIFSSTLFFSHVLLISSSIATRSSASQVITINSKPPPTARPEDSICSPCRNVR